jgi:hypothetical protein
MIFTKLLKRIYYFKSNTSNKFTCNPGHSIRLSYTGRLQPLRRRIHTVYGRIRVVYGPYFVVIQVGGLRPFLRRAYTACLRLKYDERISTYVAVFSPYMCRIAIVYDVMCHRIHRRVSRQLEKK